MTDFDRELFIKSKDFWQENKTRKFKSIWYIKGFGFAQFEFTLEKFEIFRIDNGAFNMADQNFEKSFDLGETQFPEVFEVNEFETYFKI